MVCQCAERFIQPKCNPRVRAVPLSPISHRRDFSVPRSRLVDSAHWAQVPGYNSMGYTDLQAATASGISGDRTLRRLQASGARTRASRGRPAAGRCLRRASHGAMTPGGTPAKSATCAWSSASLPRPWSCRSVRTGSAKRLPAAPSPEEPARRLSRVQEARRGRGNARAHEPFKLSQALSACLPLCLCLCLCLPPPPSQSLTHH